MRSSSSVTRRGDEKVVMVVKNRSATSPRRRWTENTGSTSSAKSGSCHAFGTSGKVRTRSATARRRSSPPRSSDSRWSRTSIWRATVDQFAMNGRIKRGSNTSENMLGGDPSAAGSSTNLANSLLAARLLRKTFASGEITVRGYGSWLSIMRASASSIAVGIAARAGSGKRASKPAARSASLRSRRGTSSASRSSSTIASLGCARPDSRKLRWRAETPACIAKSSCESPPLPPQNLSNAEPTRPDTAQTLPPAMNPALTSAGN